MKERKNVSRGTFTSKRKVNKYSGRSFKAFLSNNKGCIRIGHSINKRGKISTETLKSYGTSGGYDINKRGKISTETLKGYGTSGENTNSNGGKK